MIASIMVLLAAVLVGCLGEEAAASPRAKDDHATTIEGREVMTGMVANDTGESLQIDGFEPGGTNGDIICETSSDVGTIQSCAYTPTKGFTGTNKFEYKVKDANGKTDTAMVYVEAESAN